MKVTGRGAASARSRAASSGSSMSPLTNMQAEEYHWCAWEGEPKATTSARTAAAKRRITGARRRCPAAFDEPPDGAAKRPAAKAWFKSTERVAAPVASGASSSPERGVMYPWEECLLAATGLPRATAESLDEAAADFEWGDMAEIPAAATRGPPKPKAGKGEPSATRCIWGSDADRAASSPMRVEN